MFLYRRSSLALVCCVLLLCAACGSSPHTAQTPKATPTATPLPTAGPGQQLLSQVAHTLNTARTLHGFFNVTITGATYNGSAMTEIWSATPNSSRSEVHTSTMPQIAPGTVDVSNSKQIWQYDPVKNVVYTGPASTQHTSSSGSNTGTAGGQSGQGQFILTLVQDIFTHSDATLVSSSTSVRGHAAYDAHVVPQSLASSANSSIGSFNYAGEVYIDKATTLPLEVNLTLQGFGQVVLDVSDLALNQTLPASLFTFVVPAGVKTLPLQQAGSTPDTGSLTLAQAEQQAGYHLLSIPTTMNAYQLQAVNALGAPGNQVYTLAYNQGTTSFTIAEGKPLANLPGSGQQVSVRGATGMLSTNNGTTTLAWTEHGIGIHITGSLSNRQALAIAQALL